MKNMDEKKKPNEMIKSFRYSFFVFKRRGGSFDGNAMVSLIKVMDYENDGVVVSQLSLLIATL